jgi:CBS domain-containing protein
MSEFSEFSLPAGWRSGGLGGEAVLPGQPGNDKARLAFNPAAHERPVAGVFAESPHDVAAAARFAAERGQQVAAQATGHDALPLGLLADSEVAVPFVPRSGLGSGSGGRALRTVEANAHCAAAVYLMKRAGATAMVVVDDGMSNSPVGVITEGDLAQSVADGNNLNEIRIHELMTIKRRSTTQAASSVVGGWRSD